MDIEKKDGSSKFLDFPSTVTKKTRDFINLQIRKKAILATKARLAEHHKSFDDYDDDELEIIIADEERKIIDDLKTKSLVVALAALGLNLFV